MGGCVSVSVPCDPLVNHVCQRLCVGRSYVHNLCENLKSLQDAIRVLRATRDDVQRWVDREEFTSRLRRFFRVKVWLTSVNTIENQFTDLFSTSEVELQRLCLCGFCSKNLKLSYRYGERVFLMLRDVEHLISLGYFDKVTEPVSVAEVEEMPIQPTIVGQEVLLERVWNRLMDDQTGIIGVYGMGGVGKTTLLMQINNKLFEKRGKFDMVIWIAASKSSEISKIQGDIAKRLGLEGEEWDKKHRIHIANDIHSVLRRRRFVLFLDGIQDRVDLEDVGIPRPSKENGCKVAFTTRSQNVCGLMEVDDPMEVSCLEPDEAWSLFQERVGKNTLASHPDIPQLARKVADKCRRLPLALNVVGRAMASKRGVQEWHRAVDVLTSSASDFSGMGHGILSVLKYSYDNLNEEQVKSCFLYCSIFPEDYVIGKEKLIDYWICEGLIDENQGRERALHQGYEILGVLIRDCLLFEGTMSGLYVKMHDLVREMALWIESDQGKHRETCIVQVGAGLSELPKPKHWKAVRRMSLAYNNIEQLHAIPECVDELTTLLLQMNKLVNISGEFFLCMPRLVLLDLSLNDSLDGLPEEISELASLRYLNLSSTNIEHLPSGLRELKKLIHLNLASTKRLESVSGISSLSTLRILLLRQSFVSLDLNLMKELQLLEHLEVLTVDIKSNLIVEQLLRNHRMIRYIQEVSIREIQEEPPIVLTLPSISNLRDLSIWSCEISDIKIERVSPTTPCFPNLSSVVINKCADLKDVTWLLFAPNLTNLEVSYSEKLEDIISEDKAASISSKEHAGVNVPFGRLKQLVLFNLPMLKSIYSSALPFPCLRKISIYECPRLRKLPLDAAIGVVRKELVIEYKEKEWIEGIQWKDTATQLRFLPSCQLLSQASSSDLETTTVLLMSSRPRSCFPIFSSCC